MKIHLTQGAKKQLQLLTNLDIVKTGFVTGTEMGKTIIIETFFPVCFNEKNIPSVYQEVFEIWGEKLIGPFFKTGNIFDSQWFTGDIVIEITPGQERIKHRAYKQGGKSK